MTTEWYRFFWNIYGFTGTGVVPVNKGGTGLDTIGNHQLIIGNANNVFEPASLSSASIAITYPAGFINLELGTSGVTPGTYGSASQVGVFTVNQYGVLTAASNTSIGIDASQIISGTLPVIRGGTGQSTYTNGQLLIGNSTGNTLTKATLTAGTGISVTNGAGSITIANTGVLSVSGTAPVVSSGGATPAISMAAANTTTDGYLTSIDWNTFNNKAPATSGTSILYGNGSGGFSNVTIGSGISFAGGTLSATGSGGTVTSVTGTSPVVSSGGTTPAISLATAYGDTLNPYASKTANYFLAAPNGSAGVPTFRAIVAADVPALAYVTSVSGTGTVNGITLTGTVTSSGNLTLGGTLSGIGNSQLTNSTISGVALGGNLFNLTAGTGVSFSAGTTYNGSAAITINATGTGGTVTSVAALTLGTTGTDLSSTVANSTTTPVITLNVPTASATNRGALSAADWTTFNSKAPGVTFTTNYIPYGQGTTTLNQSAGLQFDGTNFTTTGYATATSFRPSSSTIPTNGLYLPAANTIGWSTNSTARMQIDSSGNLTVGTGGFATYGKFTTLSTGTPALAYASIASSNSSYGGGYEASLYIGAAVSGIVNNTQVCGWRFKTSSPNQFGGSLVFQGASKASGSTAPPDVFTTLMTLDANGSLALTKSIGLGAAAPSTSGAGITFPATQSASTDANTLDDYEEGTWTPAVTAGSGTITTVGTVVGVYTKIGRLVTISFSVAITTNGTGASYIQITGLPFAPNATPGSFTGSGFQNSTGKALSVASAVSTIYVRLYDATYPASNGETLYGTITYNV